MEKIVKAGFNHNKDLIITLIQADLKHNQLIGKLREMELHTDRYALPLHKAVSQLMGLPEKAHPQWFDIYDRFLIDAHLHPITDSLLSTAEECYELLCASTKIERHFNPQKS